MVLRYKVRDTHSFYSGFFICPPPHLVRHLPKASASKRKSTLLVRCQVLNSLAVSKSQNPPRASGALRRSYSLAPFLTWAIVTSLNDTSAPPAHAREHLRKCCTSVTHALSRKVLSLTKPKGIKRNPSAIILHIIEGDPKAPFSIASTPRCRRGRYSFPGLLHFTLDTYVSCIASYQLPTPYNNIFFCFFSFALFHVYSRINCFDKFSIYLLSFCFCLWPILHCVYRRHGLENSHPHCSFTFYISNLGILANYFFFNYYSRYVSFIVVPTRLRVERVCNK